MQRFQHTSKTCCWFAVSQADTDGFHTSCHRSPQKTCLPVSYLAVACLVHRVGLLINQGDCDADHVAIVQPQLKRYLHKQHLFRLALYATVGSCKGLCCNSRCFRTHARVFLVTSVTINSCLEQESKQSAQTHSICHSLGQSRNIH